MCTANQISDRANILVKSATEESSKTIKEIRKYEIKPELRIKAAHFISRKLNAGTYIIWVTNIGSGAAKDIGLMAYESSIGYNKNVFHTFYPKHTFPDFSSGIYLFDTLYRRPIKPPDPERTPGQDYILSNQELEFQYGLWKLGCVPITNTLTFFVSYYDIDGNEYMAVTSLMPGEYSMGIYYNKENPPFDSLNALTKNIKPYQHKTYENLNWRKDNEWFPTVGSD